MTTVTTVRLAEGSLYSPPTVSKPPTSSVYDGRQLETQALAKRGGRLDENIVPLEGGENNLALEGSDHKSANENFRSSIVGGCLNRSVYLNVSLLNCLRSVKSMSWKESLLARGMTTDFPTTPSGGPVSRTNTHEIGFFGNRRTHVVSPPARYLHCCRLCLPVPGNNAWNRQGDVQGAGRRGVLSADCLLTE